MIEDITAGDYDGRLDQVIAAVLARLSEVGSTLNWRITLEGDTWDAESVTLAELAYAEKLAGVSYLTIDPTRSMGHLVALLVAHFKVVDGLKPDLAVEKANKYTVSDLKDIVSLYESGAVGKGVGETSLAL